MSDRKDWFLPKRYGYGAGLPIAWQGWVLLVGFLFITGALAIAFNRQPRQFLAAIVPVTAVFLVICARTTKGGWRWRWGKEEESH